MKQSPFFILFVALVLSLGSEAFAAEAFSSAIQSGVDIFTSVRTIVYILGAFALAGFSTAAIFGKINWMWLASIALGLFLISIVDGIIDFVTDDTAVGSAIRSGTYNPTGGGGLPSGGSTEGILGN